MRKIFIFLLCFCTIFLCFVIPSFADDGISPLADVPTDLTGYSVTLPAGWTSVPQKGSYNPNVGDILSGTITSSSLGTTSFDAFSIGGRVTFYFNVFPDYNLDTTNYVSYSNTEDIILTFSSFSSSNGQSYFIQWLVDNNATFEPASTPVPETSSIAGGIYHFKTFGNLPDIPDAGWSDGEGYTYSYTLAGKYVTTSRTIAFTGFNITFDEYVSSSYYTITFSVDTDDGIVNLATYSVSYGLIELETRADLKYLVFDEALIGTYNDIEFIRQFLVSGFPDTDTSATNNPWAYILEMIIEALKVDLFGYFSVWDIFTTICGIFIVTWLLKLLAGG